MCKMSTKLKKNVLGVEGDTRYLKLKLMKKMCFSFSDINKVFHYVEKSALFDWNPILKK